MQFLSQAFAALYGNPKNPEEFEKYYAGTAGVRRKGD